MQDRQLKKKKRLIDGCHLSSLLGQNVKSEIPANVKIDSGPSLIQSLFETL